MSRPRGSNVPTFGVPNAGLYRARVQASDRYYLTPSGTAPIIPAATCDTGMRYGVTFLARRGFRPSSDRAVFRIRFRGLDPLTP